MYAELKQINGTPFADVYDFAERVFDRTAAEGGGTWLHDGPGFVEPWTLYQGDGYSVGGYQDSVEVDLTTGNGEPVHEIASFLQRIPYTGEGKKRYGLGTWIDNDVLYIDAVQIWADFDNAIAEGKRLNQIAVYGFREGASFTCSDYTIDEYGEAVLTLEPIDQVIEEKPVGEPKLVSLDEVLDVIRFWRGINESNRETVGKDLSIANEYYRVCIAEDDWLIDAIEERFK